MEEKIDDGSLSFLNINTSKETKQFNCDLISQKKLVNMNFYVIDYISGISTKHGEDRYLVNIKFNLDDTEGVSKKFFTSSKHLKVVLDKISELNKFPRNVTLRPIGSSYFFE